MFNKTCLAKARLLSVVTIIRLATVATILTAATGVSAHEEGAPFSAAIIDPLLVHHAHLEDEQRLNMFFSKGFRRADGKKRFAFMNEYELAIAKDFTWGAEIFIPFSTGGVGRDYGVGDIEVQLIKWAFVNQPTTIVTAALSLTLPTGSERHGLSDGNTVFAPHLFFDQGLGNWYFGFNFAPNVNLRGGQGLSLEYSTVISYSFIGAMEKEASLPKQNWVLIPSLEFIGESGLRGEERGQTSISLLPGLSVWHVRTGWQVHSGVQVPTSKRREDDLRFLFQVGNHFDWTALGRTSAAKTAAANSSMRTAHVVRSN